MPTRTASTMWPRCCRSHRRCSTATCRRHESSVVWRSAFRRSDQRRTRTKPRSCSIRTARRASSCRSDRAAASRCSTTFPSMASTRSRFASGGNSTTTSSVSARRTGSRCAWMASAFSPRPSEVRRREPRLRRASWGRCSGTPHGRSTLSARTPVWKRGSGHGRVHGSWAWRSCRGSPRQKTASSRPRVRAGSKNVTRCWKAIQRSIAWRSTARTRSMVRAIRRAGGRF